MLSLIYKSVSTLIFGLLGLIIWAQQVPDTLYSYPLKQSAYELGKGSSVCIDAGHHNFHTLESGFNAFARLLTLDGYRVGAVDQDLSGVEQLDKCDILVISNALHESNIQNWVLPNPSAFSSKEIDSIKKWVQGGGKLLLIADHMPFAGAASALAEVFGVGFLNGFARTGGSFWPPSVFTRENGLQKSPVTEGLQENEYINQLATFTGSAFSIPENAEAVISFNSKHMSLQPDTAWSFHDNTPTTSLEHYYQGALIQFGKGRVAVFGEAAMFTAQIANNGLKVGINSDYAPQNAQFVLNLIHWLDEVKVYSGPTHQYPLQPDEQAILDQLSAMTEAFNKNNFSAVAEVYADEAVLVGNKQVVEGRSAINSYWAALEDRGISWELENLFLEVDKNMAYQRGISRMNFIYNNEEHRSDVRFTLVWKRIQGEWRIMVDHYSTL